MSSEIAFSAFQGKTILSIAALGILLIGIAWWKTQSINLQPVIAIGTILLVLVISCFLAWQLSTIRMQVADNQLTVSSGLYQVSLPMEQIERDAIQIRKPDDKRYALKWRTNGIGHRLVYQQRFQSVCGHHQYGQSGHHSDSCRIYHFGLS